MIIGALLYILLAVLVGQCGKTLKLGFWGFFFVSLLLTPVTGFIVFVLLWLGTLVGEAKEA